VNFGGSAGTITGWPRPVLLLDVTNIQWSNTWRVIGVPTTSATFAAVPAVPTEGISQVASTTPNTNKLSQRKSDLRFPVLSRPTTTNYVETPIETWSGLHRQIAPGEHLHTARDHERIFSPSTLTKASARATPRSVSGCGLKA